MVIRGIGLWSVTKLFAVMYGLIGLLVGILISLASLVGASQAATGSMMVGASAFIVAPIGYGLLGALAGLIGGLFFNLAASITGGLEVEAK